jgi:modulator of FtsH protease HflC
MRLSLRQNVEFLFPDMKRNTVTIIIGVLLLLIFILLLFTFQVRQTQVAVVTTFGKPSVPVITEPGLHWKWPPPIQKVYIFDQRIHTFEGRFEQTLSKDAYPLLVSVYVGWTISQPTNFFGSFESGKAEDAEPALAALVENGKNEIIGKHPFSHFVSVNANELKFTEIEQEILQAVQPVAQQKYGIEVRFVGIKRLGLPESVTEKVFARMQAEREREIQLLKAQGEAQAMNIKGAADRDRAQILSEAAAQATAIRGQAQAKAAESFAIFERNPELALLIMKWKTLEESLKVKSTLVFDDRISPFDLLTNPPKSPPQTSPATKANQLPGSASSASGESALRNPQ